MPVEPNTGITLPNKGEPGYDQAKANFPDLYAAEEQGMAPDAAPPQGMPGDEGPQDAAMPQDPMMDMGKGEVCMHDVDPLDVYVDPNSRHRMFDDAENIIVSRLYTRDQAKKLYPMYEKAIANASQEEFDTDRPTTDREDDGVASFPEDTVTQTYSNP